MSGNGVIIMFAQLPRFSPIAIVSRLVGVKLETQLHRRMASTLPRSPVLEAIASHDPTSTAVIHSASRRRFTYGELVHDVAEAKAKLLVSAGDTPTDGQRIAFLVENGYDYVGADIRRLLHKITLTDTHLVTLLSVLSNNSIAVPLSPDFPLSELRYILDNSEALMLLTSAKFRSKVDNLIKEGLQKTPVLTQVEKRLGGNTVENKAQLQDLKNDLAGMMLYTSGTTSRPVRSGLAYIPLLTKVRARKACYYPNRLLQLKLNR